MPNPTGLTEAAIEDWCRAYLARKLKRTPDSIGREASFDSLGLDSAESVFMVAALEEWCGLELSSDTAIEHPSLAQLSAFLVGVAAGRLASR
ncbi:MAG: acyl carrier protein [Rhodopila sp.]